MIQLSQYPLNEDGSDMRNLTHFIDDRWSILQELEDMKCRYLFSSGARDSGVPKRLIRKGLVLRADWQLVLADIDNTTLAQD